MSKDIEINVEELSDEELEKQFAEAKGEEQQAPEETAEEPTEDTPEKSEVEEEQPEEGKEEQEEIDYKAKYEEMQERYTNLNKAYDRQGTDVGTLRKRIEALEADLNQSGISQEDQEKLNERFIEEPTAAAQDLFNRLENEKQRRDELHNLKEQEYFAQNEAYIRDTVKDADDLIKVLPDYLRSMNIDEGTINTVMRNPYNEPAEYLIPFLNGARTFSENQQLKAQIESLKGKEERILSNVEKAVSGNSPMTSKQPGAGTSINSIPDLSEMDIMELSDSELDVLLKKARKE